MPRAPLNIPLVWTDAGLQNQQTEFDSPVGCHTINLMLNGGAPSFHVGKSGFDSRQVYQQRFAGRAAEAPGFNPG